MRLKLSDCSAIEVGSAADLEALIPRDWEGRVLNYGQGEGQFELGGFVWGIYVDDEGCYTLCFEEGECSVAELQGMIQALEKQLSSAAGAMVNLRPIGSISRTNRESGA